MFRQTRIVVIAAVFGLISLPGLAATPKKPEKPDSARASVEKVLRVEIAGRVDRREQLTGTLKALPESSLARWQAGFVRTASTWQSYDAASTSGADHDSRRDYSSRREQAGKTFQDQLDLAGWCRKRGLVDQEQAHLSAALALAPQDEQPSLLARLGWQRVGTQWLSREQILEWQRGNRAAAVALKKWSSKLDRIAERLSGAKRQREAALAELFAITDRSVVPAIELVLAGHDEPCAQAAIDAFRRIEGPESSLALAKQASFSEWPEVRKSASTVLKSRNFEEFVPGLISLLALPAQKEVRFVRDAAGVPLLQSYVLAVETQDQFRVQVFHVVNEQIDIVVERVRRGRPDLPLPTERVAVGPAMQRIDDVRLISDRLYAHERQQDVVDDRINAVNAQVSHVLEAVSGVDASGGPRAFWNWWSDQSDTQLSDKKAVVIVSEQEATLATYTPVVLYVSCFTAGTPVWTESGLEPIEKLCVGDRVLAKDIETGELAYKVVLQTTVRPPKELTTLRFAEESIVCTGGHRFWGSGSGWIKARDLKAQTMLHTVTGNAPVWTAKQGETAETYNLVVADFHTYFVGKTGVLCQDLLIPHGTNTVVPGLLRN
ncbi:MAG: hypothetical protein HY290_32965 [Planctomycetia bacterium]|nr:hypothetical protein [Planctomycetia bacterium]